MPNHHKSRKTITDHAERSQITENHHRSRSTGSDHAEPSQFTHKSLRLSNTNYRSCRSIMPKRLRSSRIPTDHAEPGHTSQNHQWSPYRTITYDAKPAQISQNYHRSSRTGSDHAGQSQITPNHLTSHRTITNTQNHLRLRRIDSDRT